jgi:hypothetical protein
VNVQITVEIHAESAAGFDESLQRTIRENARTLGFLDSGFEGGSRASEFGGSGSERFFRG